MFHVKQNNAPYRMFHVKHSGGCTYTEALILAAKKKTGTGKRKKSHVVPEKKTPFWFRFVLMLSALLIIPIFIWMYLESRVVHLVHTDVPVRNLPPSFDGFNILFISDLHMCGYASPEHTMGLLEELGALNPDMLIMGGDYTHTDFFGGKEREAERRESFFSMMAAFQAPFGKYCVAGNHDVELDMKTDAVLEAAAETGGVKLLRNECAYIEKDGQTIVLMGLDDWQRGTIDVRNLSKSVGKDDCVIVVSHNPDAFPRIMTEQAIGGGDWADLMLCGHMHGGQVTFFGFKAMHAPSIYGDRYISGWYRENHTRMVVSNGVGSVSLPIRLLAPAQAHLLTLRVENDR